MTSISTVVCGRTGRMATVLAQGVRHDPGLELVGHLRLRPGADDSFRSLAEVPGPTPVVIDFTVRAGTVALLRQAEATPCALVIGTSGLTADDHTLLRAVSRSRAVVFAANFSPALALVRRFVREVASSVDPSWGAGVLDLHFAGKRDRPSATGQLLADTWRDARKDQMTVDVLSLRIGDAVSEHRLVAAGRGEQLEVAHRVNDRTAFVPGVVAAVRFAARAEPGLYTVEDVLWG